MSTNVSFIVGCTLNIIVRVSIHVNLLCSTSCNTNSSFGFILQVYREFLGGQPTCHCQSNIFLTFDRKENMNLHCGNPLII